MTMRDGAALVRARQMFGLTVDDMAARLGLPVVELGEIESGRRDLSIKDRNKIERVMGFTLDDFAPNPNKMDLYVVIVDDRHADPEPYLFSTEEAAMSYARQTAQDWLVEAETPDGWLYYATHRSEGDSVWVLAKAVDDPDAIR